MNLTWLWAAVMEISLNIFLALDLVLNMLTANWVASLTSFESGLLSDQSPRRCTFSMRKLNKDIRKNNPDGRLKHCHLSHIPYWHLYICHITFTLDLCMMIFMSGVVGGPETTVRFGVSTFVAMKKLDIFDKTSGHFPAVFVATKPVKVNQVNDLFLTLTSFFFCLKLTRP